MATIHPSTRRFSTNPARLSHGAPSERIVKSAWPRVTGQLSRLSTSDAMTDRFREIHTSLCLPRSFGNSIAASTRWGSNSKNSSWDIEGCSSIITFYEGGCH
ncbi:protein of unknown function (plasmid) [Azospirillum baldaniorum]|uniref:Uncharacterized protein n=1 Tax=Azospirillum baldaniorum TaxID=1064539 RepID=A0A9P1K0F3_9PROT|nr:protein of unknown function [Azospirillum baldaniorum]